ncbi:MAG: hypothetical protein PVJ19_05240 [Desulfobacteraceae bacterium]|jgi:hypothetical protein
MGAKKSRYEKVRPFVYEADETALFLGIRPRTISTPDGVIEHVVVQGERLDLLSLYYYNDTHMWWRILDANPEILFGGELSMDRYVGAVILIPRIEDERGR